MSLFSSIHIFVIHLIKNCMSQSKIHGIMNGFLLETKHQKYPSLCTYIQIHRKVVISISVSEPSQLLPLIVQFVLKIVV